MRYFFQMIRALALLLLAVALAAAGWWYWSSRTSTLEFRGISQPVEIPVSFPIPGRIAEIAVKSGQRVEEGSVLARLETATLEESRQRALRSHQKAQELLARLDRAVSELKSQGQTDGLPGVEKELADQRRLVEQSQQEIAAVGKQMEASVALAPVQGSVSRIVTIPGSTLQAGEPVLGLVDPARADVLAFLPASQLGALHAGDKVEVRPTSGERAYTGVVKSIAVEPEMPPEALFPLKEAQQPGYRVHIELSEPGLVAGAEVTVRAILAR